MAVKNSSDAYRLIHSGLAGWIEGSIEDGFADDPHGQSEKLYVDELMTLASRMRVIEGHTDIEEAS